MPDPGGFAEAQAVYKAASPTPAGHAPARAVGRLTVGTGGRLVVPAEVRAALGVKEGDTLVASLVGDELHLVPMAVAVQRAQAFVQASLGAQPTSVVDEFLAEKRREQAHEDRT